MGKKFKKRKVAPPLTPEHPWERQPEESDTAWQAFAAYRDMGPGERSLVKLVRKYAKGKANFTRWSAQWDWVARCAAFDSWLDRQSRLAKVEAIEKMHQRHIEMAQHGMQSLGLLVLQKMGRAERTPLLDAAGKPVIDDKGNPVLGPPTLKPNEALAILETGLKVERLNRGEPTEIEMATLNLGERMPVQSDFSALTLDELRTLRALTRKARGDA